jgi:DNA repair photolyase
MKHDFEDIEVKRGAAQILEQQLRRKRKPCMVSTGAMCDPYIPLEDRLRVTRQCLELIERYGFGLAIQTKSARILRDLDVLDAINRKTKCVVQMTLTTFDDGLCSIVEPNVSTTSERFAALEAFRDAGIPTVAWLSPILPFINDTQENLRGLLDYCVRAHVKAVMCFGFGMTLRDGSREYYYARLEESFPGLKERYIAAFGDSYECQSPRGGELWALLQSECSRHGILCGTDSVFAYLRAFEGKASQMSLFELADSQTAANQAQMPKKNG